MRLFAAVDPPAAEVTALSATLGERDGRVRWVGEHQWHVTLAFYGEVPEAVVAGLQERLARAAARTAPFSLRLAGGGSFPRQARRARQVWVGLDGDLPALHRLAERCVAVGRREGLDLPDRPYRPHLTLGRARGDTVDATDLVTRLSSYAGAAWPVTSFRLVRSILGPSVAHSSLQEFALRSSS